MRITLHDSTGVVLDTHYGWAIPAAFVLWNGVDTILLQCSLVSVVRPAAGSSIREYRIFALFKENFSAVEYIEIFLDSTSQKPIESGEIYRGVLDL